MQHSPAEIKARLLNALDQDNNVIDIPAVMEIIGVLETMCITKEILETTRLGKYVNELRKRTDDSSLAKRAKDLVRKWRALIEPASLNNGSALGPPLNLKMMTSSCMRSQPSPCAPPVAGVLFSTVISPMNSLPSSGSASPSIPHVDTALLSVNCSKTLNSGPGRPGHIEHLHKCNSYHIPASPHQHHNKRSLFHSPETDSNKDSVDHVCFSTKRSRKDEDLDELDISVIPLSGINHFPIVNGLEDSQSIDEGSRDSFTSAHSDIASSQHVISEKRNSCHSKQRNTSVRQGHDLLKEQFALLANRNTKVKTTKEIVAKLAQSSGSESLAAVANQLPESLQNISTIASSSSKRSQNYTDLSKNKSELIEKFLQSQTQGEPYIENSTTISNSTDSANIHIPKIEQEIQDILCQLPPLHSVNIVWNDDELADHPPVCDEVVQRLHSEQVDCMNGNYDFQGKFKHWNEIVLQSSHNDELLPILPYVILD